MRRLRPAHVSLAALLVTGCYLSHGRPGGNDAGAAPGTAPVGAECCVEVTCAADENACALGATCGPWGCAECAGPRCGEGCCAAGELCADGACVEVGPACADDAACGADRRCDPVGRRCVPVPVTGCFAARPFDPMIEWSQSAVHSISVPLVAQLTDDDGDGAIDARDVPDLVLVEQPNRERRARVVAYSGDDGRRLWTVDDRLTGFCSHATAAVGDLDGDGTVEIAVPARRVVRHVHVGDDPRLPCVRPPFDDCPLFPADRGYPHDHGTDVDPRIERMHVHPTVRCSTFDSPPGSVAILSHEGEVERFVDLPLLATEQRAHTLLLTDLEGDGAAELVVGGSVIDAAGVRWSDPRIQGVGVAAGDIDLDGRVELVTARHALDDDGALLWEAEGIDSNGHPAIARVVDLDASGPPQIVVVDGERIEARDAATGATVWGPVRFGAGMSSGPPTIADFDGDGEPEIGVVSDHAYVMFDPGLPPPHIRWELQSDDTTTGTVGSSAFDFDSDGAADVAFADECHVRILSGRDGSTLWARSSPSMTIWEYPVVADVDGDDEAELIVVSNIQTPGQITGRRCRSRDQAWLPTRGGLRVFGDRLGHWAPTRRTWNQHGYVLDAIAEDGALPGEVTRPWEAHNTVRANPWLGHEEALPLPDLVVAATRVTTAACGRDAVFVEARVENHGNVGAPAGVEVQFGGYGSSPTTDVLLPGGAQWVRSPPIRRDRLAPGALTVTVDPRGLHPECDGSNGAAHVTLRCVRE